MGFSFSKKELNFSDKSSERCTQAVGAALIGNVHQTMPVFKTKMSETKRSDPPDKDGKFIKIKPLHVKLAEKENEVSLLKMQLEDVKRSLCVSNDRISCLENQIALLSKNEKLSSTKVEEKVKFAESLTSCLQKPKEIEQSTLEENEISVKKITDTNKKIVPNDKSTVIIKESSECKAFNENIAKAKRNDETIDHQNLNPKGEKKRDEGSSDSLSKEICLKKHKKETDIPESVQRSDIPTEFKWDLSLIPRGTFKAVMPSDKGHNSQPQRKTEKKNASSKSVKSIKKVIDKKGKSQSPKMKMNKPAGSSNNNAKNEKPVVSTGKSQKPKFERKKKSVVSYTKDQLIAFAKGEKVFETTKYKLVKLVGVKRMSDDRIDQFCSKILGITRYNRGGLVFSNELDSYILLINEKLLISKNLIGNEKMIGVTVKEVSDYNEWFKAFSYSVMKKEIAGNKPLFIAANLLNKAVEKKNKTLLYPVLIIKAFSEPEK